MNDERQNRDRDDWTARARVEMERKTKPPGSLGRLEEIAIRLAAIQRTVRPDVSTRRLLLFAGDHGVTEEGISPYPAAVTAQMILNFLRGGAAVSVLARLGDITMRVIDVGVAAQWTPDVIAHPEFRACKIRAGTRNLARECAMTSAECDAALDAGRQQVAEAAADGVRLLGLGEMGIGNTTSAAALCAALFHLTPADCVGRGTGADPDMLARKRAIVERALEFHQRHAGDARSWLEAVGGFEIAAMTGAVLEAARRGIAIVIDGFIATAAAAAAFALQPSSREVCFFAHRSDERGHARVLSMLGVEPLLALGMRLGEGTGAALAMHLIAAAARILREMATFDSAGVDGRRAADPPAPAHARPARNPAEAGE